MAVMLSSAQAALETDFTTVKASFNKMSVPNNDWMDANKVGCILGFSVFGLMYIYTVVMIFIDTCKRGTEYEALIENDLAEM